MNLMQRRNNYLVFNEINKPLLSLTRKAGAFIIFFQRLMRLIFLYIIISTFGEKPYLNNLIYLYTVGLLNPQILASSLTFMLPVI